ncbi:acetyltransferase [Novosphingobium barchaimii LL02]|uniref:Acetyltransferase n=1 Tax=Novosphingobium barchaimii LL02 TaxID=1114963 RepID=A0A0J8AY84_9SPHN|nr:acyltransferase [Novosphingobium barchaimii]KMS59170.1 acetyltransferase [Novosphingobium barchaimii LL02]
MTQSDHAGTAPWQGRHITLDGMRGIAALAVALFHYNISQAPHGYVAVDFFFALSGFVLCKTYLPRWQAGLTTWAFMKQRVIRLYPLFFVGIVVTTFSAISNHFTGQGNFYSYEMMAQALPFNLLMLPSPVTNTLFPLNVPAWSLFFELVANLGLVLLLFRLPRIGLLALTMAAAWWFALAVLKNDGGNLGAVWHQLGISMVRTTMSFTAGVLLARFPIPEFRPAGWMGLACLAAIAAMLMLDIGAVPDAYYDLACSIVVSPLLVWLGARCEPPRVLAPIAWFLGEVSYAVYAVHWALMEPLRYFKDDLGYDPVLMGVVYLACCVALGWAGVRWVDAPMRRKIGAMLRERASRAPSLKGSAATN